MKFTIGKFITVYVFNQPGVLSPGDPGSFFTNVGGVAVNAELIVDFKMAAVVELNSQLLVDNLSVHMNTILTSQRATLPPPTGFWRLLTEF